MKSYGLVFAIVFGLLGACLNYLYISTKAGEVEMVGFIGIAPDKAVPAGVPLKETDLVVVKIPRKLAGNLDKFAFPASAMATVIGERVIRDKEGGSLLWRDDLKTPPPELKLEPDEVLLFVPVDTKTFVPSLISPGDRVSFIVPQTVGPMPASQFSPDSGSQDLAGAGTGMAEQIGPFVVASVGSRLGSSQVYQASRRPVGQESIVSIRVRLDPQGQLPAKAKRLMDMLRFSGYRPVALLLHGPEEPSS